MNRSDVRRFKRTTTIAKPVGEELVLYDADTNTAHCLNHVAAGIWTACEQESSAAEITEALRATRPEIKEEEVLAALKEMVRVGVFEEALAEYISPSRRELIYKIGLAAAVALPIAITSVLVPPPAAAASCARLGQSCTTRPCCPGLGLGCVSGVCVSI